jgi:hypothetical protein
MGNLEEEVRIRVTIRGWVQAWWYDPYASYRCILMPVKSFWWQSSHSDAFWCIFSKANNTAHIASINGNPLHRYNVMVKSTKTLQFRHISHRYSNLWCSQWEFWLEESWPWHKTIMTSKTNIDQYKLTPVPHISNSLCCHNLAYYLAHRLSIARYCLRFAPHLYYCITYRFFICNAP